MRLQLRSFFTLLAAFALALPQAAQAYSASGFARAGAGVSIIGAPGSKSDDPADRTAATTLAGPLTVSNSAYALTTEASYTASATGHASATVIPGAISLMAAGYGGGTASPPTWYQTDNTGYAYASAAFQDRMQLDIAGVNPGTLVKVDFSVRFDGNASVTRTAVAGGWGKGGGDYQWGLQINSAGWGAGMIYASGTRTYQQDDWGNVTFNTLDFGTKSFSAWLMTGTPLGLSAWAWAQAFGRGGTSFCPAGCTDQMAGGGNAVMDVSHTLSWEGVQGISLADGTVVNLATVSLLSETGVNLLLPVTSVPEPMSAVLLVLGLGLLSVAQRRRAR